MSFKKETEKILLLQVKDLIKTIVKFRTYTAYYGVHVSSPWGCTHVPKVSANKAYKKNCLLEFPTLLASA